MNTIHAFSVALGIAESGFTDSELYSRRAEARRTALAFMPSLRFLIDTSIEERLLAQNGCLWLAFDLVISPQLLLEFERFGKGVHHGSDSYRFLYDELSRLKDEAENLVIRVGELTHLSKMLSQINDKDSVDAVEGLPPHNLIAWQLMHHRAGHKVSLRVENKDISVQLPLIPEFVPESGTRLIRGRISNISKQNILISDVEDLHDPDEPHRQLVTSNKDMKISRPPMPVGPERANRFLLHIAEEGRITVELQVRMIMFQQDLSPAYFEFRNIVNSNILLAHFSKLSAFMVQK